MEDWTCLGQHKRQPEFPVVTRESRRNSRKTTWLPRHRKMKPFPATAPQEKSHVRNWRSKGHLAPLMRPTKGSRGCIPDAPGETGIHLEWKQRTPLCSRIATGNSWSSLGGLKGVKPPEAFGERSRDWSLGHAGDDGPHLSMTGESRGCSRAAAPVCGFSRGTTARSVSLSWGAREVGSPCEWRGGARHCSRAMGGDSGLETC